MNLGSGCPDIPADQEGFHSVGDSGFDCTMLFPSVEVTGPVHVEPVEGSDDAEACLLGGEVRFPTLSWTFADGFTVDLSELVLTGDFERGVVNCEFVTGCPAGLGTSLAKLGSDDAKAQKLLEHTVHVDPKNAQALALLGDIAERAGKRDDAIKRWEQVKKLRPDDQRVKKKLDELKAKKKSAKK